jgi:hypothetical protein
MMRFLKRKWFGYRLSRAFGNGRLQSTWKELGTLFGRRVFVSPQRWGWPPKHHGNVERQ